MENLDFKKLKWDLLNKVGASGIIQAIIEVDSAPKDKLIKLADKYGVDIEKYVVKQEDFA
jgi:hypothetical protein